MVTAVWGDAPLVDDIHSSRMPEPAGAEPPALATSTGDHPLWRDVKEAEARLMLPAKQSKGQSRTPIRMGEMASGAMQSSMLGRRICRLCPRRCGCSTT